MATAQREGGFYRTDKGVAVDAEGKKIDGAPKPTPDTDPSKQPGGTGAPATGPVTTMRLDDESLRALGGKVPPAPKAQGTAKTDEDDEDKALPTIKDLPAAVAKLKSVDEVKALAKRDDRVSAEPIYDARIAELEEK